MAWGQGGRETRRGVEECGKEWEEMLQHLYEAVLSWSNMSRVFRTTSEHQTRFLA
jgi:hypothetical protein